MYPWQSREIMSPVTGAGKHEAGEKHGKKHATDDKVEKICHWRKPRENVQPMPSVGKHVTSQSAGRRVTDYKL